MHEPLWIRPGSAESSARRTSLWRWPAAAVAIAFVTELITFRLDRWVADRGVRLPSAFDRGSAEDLRSLLSTIAGATVTTLGLVLSITMVVLSLTASQFGPRLIRTFLRSRSTRVTVSIYLVVFVYSILVLDSIATDGSSTLVPDIGGTLAMVGAVAAVFCLIWYVHDISRLIQVPVVMERLYGLLRRAIADTRADREDAVGDRDVHEVEAEWATRRGEALADSVEVRSRLAGYLQLVEFGPLATAATAAGAVVVLTRRAGDFVTQGDVVAAVHPASAGPALRAACERHIDLGPHRTMDQDLEFAIDQMVEIGIRALSPAINDTFTGLACIDWLGSCLRDLAAIPVDRSIHCDADGAIRVVERGRSFEGMVTAAFAKIRQSAAANPAVTIRLVDAMSRIVDDIHDDRAREAVGRELQATVWAALQCPYARPDREALLRRAEPLAECLGVELDLTG